MVSTVKNIKEKREKEQGLGTLPEGGGLGD